MKLPACAVGLLALALPMGGCRNQGDHGDELSYLRADPAHYEPALKPQELLPLTPGTRWEYRVVEEGKAERTEVLTMLPGGVVETVTDGKLTGRDTYHQDARGLWLDTSQASTLTKITPPLPMIPLPLKEEETVFWQGTLGAGRATQAGRAWARVTRREQVTTPAGTFPTVRVDLRTEVGSKGSGSMLISRWYSPGVGIVRQRLVQEKGQQTKFLVSRKIVATRGVK